MSRVPQVVLIVSTLWASWLGMQAVHEAGHIVGAWLTGGRVAQVVLSPLTISRTDLAENPQPGVVVWAGPIFGALVPLLFWGAAAAARAPWAFALRFFAGFCLLANGLYIGVGSFYLAGDCAEMLFYGSQRWQLWLFGAATAPAGLWLWHGQGPRFGLGPAGGRVDRNAVWTVLGFAVALTMLGFAVGGK